MKKIIFSLLLLSLCIITKAANTNKSTFASAFHVQNLGSHKISQYQKTLQKPSTTVTSPVTKTCNDGSTVVTATVTVTVNSNGQVTSVTYHNTGNLCPEDKACINWYYIFSTLWNR